MPSEYIIVNDPTTNPEDIANSYNDFLLLDVGKNLAENKENNIDPLKYYRKQWPQH